MNKYIIALDQGTTGSRAVLFSLDLELLDMDYLEFPQIYPKNGWVEHDPLDILNSQWTAFIQLMKKHSLTAHDILSIGITNQRETTIVWSRHTGKPIYNAIVWQDRRTAEHCETLRSQGHTTYIQENTGLLIDAYFSATKLHWILQHVPGAQKAAEKGDLLFGTVDCWLIWKLTNGAVHATDASNASRTMLYNIHSHQWDTTILSLLNIPKQMLPQINNSADAFGAIKYEGGLIPISGVAGDQQAATFGQACFSKGSVKNTYGTGCFMLMNTGTDPILSSHGLLTTVAWQINNTTCYALEGSVFIAGAAIQWLRDELHFFSSAAESETIITDASADSSVIMVPAFTGLAAPYWNMYARGAIFGITRDTGPAEITKAALESIAYQSWDLIEAMQADTKITIPLLTVDGGAAANNYLMKFQSDLLNIPVNRPTVIESTARGAAALAGLYLQLWDLDRLQEIQKTERIFVPNISNDERENRQNRWRSAIKKVLAE